MSINKTTELDNREHALSEAISRLPEAKSFIVTLDDDMGHQRVIVYGSTDMLIQTILALRGELDPLALLKLSFAESKQTEQIMRKHSNESVE